MSKRSLGVLALTAVYAAGFVATQAGLPFAPPLLFAGLRALLGEPYCCCWPPSPAPMTKPSAAAAPSSPTASLIAPTEHVRQPGAGRPPVEKDPLILVALVEPETAGDPMTGQRWVRSSLRRLSRRLTARGHTISPPTVARLLAAQGFARPINAPQVEAHAQHSDRDQPCTYLDEQQAAFAAAGLPEVSVDSKKAGAGRQLQEPRCGVGAPA